MGAEWRLAAATLHQNGFRTNGLSQNSYGAHRVCSLSCSTKGDSAAIPPAVMVQMSRLCCYSAPPSAAKPNEQKTCSPFGPTKWSPWAGRLAPVGRPAGPGRWAACPRVVGRFAPCGWPVGPVWLAGWSRLVRRLVPLGWQVGPGRLAGWPRLGPGWLDGWSRSVGRLAPVGWPVGPSWFTYLFVLGWLGGWPRLLGRLVPVGWSMGTGWVSGAP